MRWRARLGDRVLAFFIDIATASSMTRGMDPSGVVVEPLDAPTLVPMFCPLCGVPLPSPPEEPCGNLFMVVCPAGCGTTNVVGPRGG